MIDRLLVAIEVVANEIIDCITHIKSVSKKKVTTERIKAHLIKKGDNNNEN